MKAPPRTCPNCGGYLHAEGGWRGGSYCRRWCEMEARWKTEPAPVFLQGLPAETSRCPHPGCGGWLGPHGGFLVCSHCDRRWPIQGYPVAQALAYERASGVRC